MNQFIGKKPFLFCRNLYELSSSYLMMW